MAKVAINGWGRIGKMNGRIIIREMLEAKGAGKESELELVAINDRISLKKAAYLFKYDSVMGKWPGSVEIDEEKSELIVDGIHIIYIPGKEPSELPWRELGIDVVIESTGIFSQEYDSKIPGQGYRSHIDAGAKKVVLSFPPKDNGAKMVVMGANDNMITKDDDCLSNASCTTNCLAPVMKVLGEKFGLVFAGMDTIHSVTASQRVTDSAGSDMRKSRSAFDNIIPTTTGGAKATGKVVIDVYGTSNITYPLKDKFDGMAFRVPTLNGSVCSVTMVVPNEVTVEEVNSTIRLFAEGSMKGIIEYTEDPIVLKDIVGNPISSIFDAGFTKVIGGRMIKFIVWYDNEWGYSNRNIMLVKKIAKM